ncbi:DUF72 domain-containing protein [Pseudomonas sp. URMO17WK12:I11]|uniref:DUF72 domain-containing protein n=1 Tax=Pseudomonas sp. URMO17WK12:I11 TaxID=1283291 RepID=UPI003FA6D080
MVNSSVCWSCNRERAESLGSIGLIEFISQCSGLNDRLDCLLVQLPPSLAFVHSVADSFFIELRQQYAGHVVLEPRHESWLDAERLLIHHRIARATVDPSRISHDALPGGLAGIEVLATARIAPNLLQPLRIAHAGKPGNHSSNSHHRQRSGQTDPLPIMRVSDILLCCAAKDATGPATGAEG